MAIVRRRPTLTGNQKRFLSLPTHQRSNKKRKVWNDSHDDDDAFMTSDDDRGRTTSHNDLSSPRTTTIYLTDLRSEVVVTPPPPTKGVRFALHDEDERISYDDLVVRHCNDTYSYDYLQEHKTDLWYPKTHRQEQQQEVQEIIATFKEEYPETVAHFASLYKSIADLHQDSVPATCAIQLPLEMRGLEWGITPQLRARRRRHVRQVLGCADESLPMSFQQVMRHSTSVKSSRAAVAMARWYAVEEEAAGIQEAKTSTITTTAKPTFPSLQNACAFEAEPMMGLPPRQPLQPERMCLWQRLR